MAAEKTKAIAKNRDARDTKAIAKKTDARDTKAIAKKTDARDTKAIVKKADARDTKAIAKKTEARGTKAIAKKTDARDIKAIAKKTDAREAKAIAKKSDTKNNKAIAKKAGTKNTKTIDKKVDEKNSKTIVNKIGVKKSSDTYQTKNNTGKKSVNKKEQSSSLQTKKENVWDTLGIPNIKDVVKKTTDTEEFKWAVFLISLVGIVALIGILYLASRIFLDHYKVETVYVEGSTHYSNDEIKDMVMEGRLGDNSLYLGFKYKDKAIENVPFVQRMDVEVIDAKAIRIRVYEKAIAGYFEHLGRYVYFDKDGIVVETSEKETPGVPLVTGLRFNYVVMYEPLPVEKKEIFEDILDITQLLNKYEIAADKIYFDNDNRKTLYFGKARVSLGSNDNIDEKILKLKYILPKLKGLSGVLRMDNYSEGVTNITFEEDKE